MNLKISNRYFTNNGCNKIYIKEIIAKRQLENQVYFGGSFEILNILPISEIKTEEGETGIKKRFKATINFSWISEDGNVYPAQIHNSFYIRNILKFLFRFLSRCQNPPSELMTQRLADGRFIFAVAKNGTVLGYVASPTSEIAKEFSQTKLVSEHGVLKLLNCHKWQTIEQNS